MVRPYPRLTRVRRRQGLTTVEQALLLVLIVVAALHIWQNFGREVAAIPDGGVDAVDTSEPAVEEEQPTRGRGWWRWRGWGRHRAELPDPLGPAIV